MADSRPLYLRLREDIVSRILQGEFADRDALPSVRTLATDVGANPLTVAKAYQQLIESGVARVRRGRGLYVADGGTERLRAAEKARFLEEDWPQIVAKIRRLQLAITELVHTEVS